tara:strand:+ start:1233 stop:2045 length:813 start_codon:yes stop_codon:yes gene_type:complete
MKSLFIIGTKGMLGSCAYNFFKKKNKVYFTNQNVNKYNYNFLINKINKCNPDFVLNCIGRIKQKKYNIHDLYFINSFFPIALAYKLNPKIILINPSTDCVFSGKNKIGYNTTCKLDAFDDYGKSKIIAEQSQYLRKNILIPRTSIIGFEKAKIKHSLLEWALSKKKIKINGYKNHFWNGITTLEWCKIIYKIINKKVIIKNKVFQIGQKNKISKFYLLKKINHIYLNDKKIIYPINTSYINRYLKPDIFSTDIDKQLSNLKDFYDKKNYN